MNEQIANAGAYCRENKEENKCKKQADKNIVEVDLLVSSRDSSVSEKYWLSSLGFCREKKAMALAPKRSVRVWLNGMFG